jgi:peroxiredoxin
MRGLPSSAWVGLAVALVAAVAAGIPGASAWAEDPAFRAMQIIPPVTEAQAPEFSLPSTEGGTATLSTLRGHVVVLNFWTTWCPACRAEMPSLERLHQELLPRGLVVLAINLRESAAEVVRFTSELGLSFPVLLDEDGQVATRYRVRALPTTVLIDRQGRVLGRAVGAREWWNPQAQALFASLLEPGRPPEAR